MSLSSKPLISHKEADVLALFPDCQVDQKSILKSRNRYQNQQHVSTQSAEGRPSFDPKDPSVQVPSRPSFRFTPRHGASHAPSLLREVNTDNCNILTLGLEA